MPALKQQALDLLSEMPEEKMPYVIDILKKLKAQFVYNNDDNQRVTKQFNQEQALAAWKELQKFRGIIDDDIDVKAELKKARDSKYARDAMC